MIVPVLFQSQNDYTIDDLKKKANSMIANYSELQYFNGCKPRYRRLICSTKSRLKRLSEYQYLITTEGCFTRNYYHYKKKRLVINPLFINEWKYIKRQAKKRTYFILEYEII